MNRPLRPSRNLLLRSVAAGLLTGMAALAMFCWVVVSPRARANDEAAAALASLHEENERTERALADYEAFKRDADATDKRFTDAIAAVPTEAEFAGALQDIETLTKASGVSLVRFAPAAPSIPPAGPPKPGKSPNGAVVAPVTARPIAVVVRCGFDDFQSLLGRLAAYPRLLTVESFRMRGANRDGFTVEAALTLDCYYKPAPDAATAAGGSK